MARSTLRHYDIGDVWSTRGSPVHNTTSWSHVSSAQMDTVNWTTTTTSSKEDFALHDCGPREYLFLFYAYYYGCMTIVTLIGVAGNTAVIR